MKAALLALIAHFCLVSITSFAGIAEVRLDRKKITVDSSDVVLIRTEKSPPKVQIQMPIKFVIQECVAHGPQEVEGTHPSCGQDYTTVNGCRDETVCRTRMGVCTPGGLFCDEFKEYQECEKVSICGPHLEARDRSCKHIEQVCVKREAREFTKEKRAELKFELPKLKKGDTETYGLKGKQYAGGFAAFELELIHTVADYDVEASKYDKESKFILRSKK